MAVIGVFAQAHIGDYQQIGNRLFDCTDGLLHDSFIQVSLAPDRVFVLRYAEQYHCGDSESVDFLAFAHRAIDRQLRDTGHGRDRLCLVFSRSDKERVDKISRLKRRFANQVSQFVISTQSSRPISREIHVALQI